jgi:hypothetical protein
MLALPSQRNLWLQGQVTAKGGSTAPKLVAFGGVAGAQQVLCGMLGGGHGMVFALGGASLH